MKDITTFNKDESNLLLEILKEKLDLSLTRVSNIPDVYKNLENINKTREEIHPTN